MDDATTRDSFLLDGDFATVNHGSYGAVRVCNTLSASRRG